MLIELRERAIPASDEADYVLMPRKEVELFISMLNCLLLLYEPSAGHSCNISRQLRADMGALLASRGVRVENCQAAQATA